jgi:hypothetical protein
MGVLSDYGSKLVRLNPEYSELLWWMLRESPGKFAGSRSSQNYFFRGDSSVLAERVEVAAMETGPMFIGLEGHYFPYLELFGSVKGAAPDDLDMRVQGPGLQAWFAPSLSRELVGGLLQLTCDKYLKYFQFSLNSRTMRIYKGDPELVQEHVYSDYSLDFMEYLHQHEKKRGES